MRTLAIGDIHGGLKALQQVLKRAHITANDTLIFLGDYVDGWSESAETIQFLIELSQQQNCIFVLGNHDLWCKQWLDKGVSNNVWLAHGGQQTVESYIRTGFLSNKTHNTFFKQLKNYYIDSKNRLFIHAGFTSMHGVKKEVNTNNYYFDRTLWESARILKHVRPEKQLSIKTRLNLYHEIYIGHTPTINYDQTLPMNICNLWNVDTGAAFDGKLSCIDIDTKQIYQSDIVQTLYPNEKGRN